MTTEIRLEREKERGIGGVSLCMSEFLKSYLPMHLLNPIPWWMIKIGFLLFLIINSWWMYFVRAENFFFFFYYYCQSQQQCVIEAGGGERKKAKKAGPH